MSIPAFLLRLMQRKELPHWVRLYPEERFAIAVANMLRQATLDGRLSAVWFHVKNEHPGRSKHAETRNAVGKAMGVIPGVLDFAFLWGTGSGVLELKVTAAVRPNQKDFIAWSEERGVRTAMCRAKEAAIPAGVALVEKTLVVWGVLAPPQIRKM